MGDYFNDVLSKFQYGFRKFFGTQNCLFYMIETRRKPRDNHGEFAAVWQTCLKLLIAFPKNF